MNEYSEEEMKEMAYENWIAHFSKLLPHVPYLEVALNTISSAAADSYQVDRIKILCSDIAMAARETALEGKNIEYLDNEIQEILERKAERPGWWFLKGHLREAAAEKLRLLEEKTLGEDTDNADGTN